MPAIKQAQKGNNMSRYTNYTSHLKADFFENGMEVFGRGYTSEKAARQEAQAYVDDQYDESQRPEVIITVVPATIGMDYRPIKK